jgi:hypothetical protein
MVFAPDGGVIAAIRHAIACSWRAWHEVPRTAATQKSRPVGNGLILIRAGMRPGRDHTVPYGTVFSVDAFPGTSCQARHEQAIARRMATIMLSPWDQIHSGWKPMLLYAVRRDGFT